MLKVNDKRAIWSLDALQLHGDWQLDPVMGRGETNARMTPRTKSASPHECHCFQSDNTSGTMPTTIRIFPVDDSQG
jgi:hypothetical protein